jgi:hypothetical protein
MAFAPADRRDSIIGYPDMHMWKYLPPRRPEAKSA